MSLLQVRQLTMRFGGLTAVDRLSMEVPAGLIYSIIGPNGAGKTTVFNAVTGIYDPTEGEILFQGRELRGPVTGRTYAALMAIALVTAIGGFCVVNIEDLWNATVTANFIYKEAFDYGAAWKDLFVFIGELSAKQKWMPMGVGGAIGLSGGFVVWRRTRRTPHVITARGIARTFQNLRIFPEMTVLENVLVGMDSKLKARIGHIVARLPLYWRERRRSEARAMELLRFVDLEEHANLAARKLSYGHQRRLEIARALATEPKLLLLDEPAAGMSPIGTEELMALICKIRDAGVTILLIEHHMRVVMGISDRIVVLDYGEMIAEGTPEEIRTDPRVIEAYLGKEEVH